MDSIRRRSYGVTFWCAVVLTSLGMYVGSYFAMLTRQGLSSGSMGWSTTFYFARFSSNQMVDDALLCFFKPLLKLDHKLCPSRWTVETRHF